MRLKWSDFDRQEREAYRALRVKPRGCPAPEKLLALDRGVLPAEAAARIESHVGSCRVCAMLAHDLRELPLPEQPAVTPHPLHQTGWIRLLAVAASIVALVVAVGLWRNGGPTAPKDPVAPTVASRPAYRLALIKAPLKLPLVPALAVRGRNDSGATAYLKELGHSLAPYYQDQFDEAERSLESLAARYPASVEPVFYLGVARLMQGDGAAAREPLERARRLGSAVLDNDIVWYLAVALERDGGFELARPLLERLCANGGSHSSSACNALASAP